jgi:hypothetical protein
VDFVVGHPRSGTKLVAELLNAGQLGVAGHEHLVERTLLGTLIEAATEYYEGRLSGEEIKDLLGGAAAEPSVQIDCNWKNTWILPPLLELHPGARVLHLVRDPRSNVIACHNLDYYGQLASRPAFEAYPMARWLQAMPRIRRPDWDGLSVFERNCAFWVETHRLVLDALSSRPEHSFRLRLESLSGREASLGVHRFFGLPVPKEEETARVLSTRVNTKVLDKRLIAEARSGILPRFEECPEAVQEALRRICGPMAARLGYDLEEKETG